MLRSFSAARCAKASLRHAFEKRPSSNGVRRLSIAQPTQSSKILKTHGSAFSKSSLQYIYPASSNVFSRHVRFYSLPPYTEIDLPALSPTMEMGTIASWVIKEGDKFEPGDLLAEIETDKATVGFEAQDDGYIAKILVAEGTKDVSLGTLIAISVENEEDVAAFKDFSADQATSSQPPAAPPTPTSTATQQHAPSTQYPEHEKIALPALSPTMTVGTIAAWAVKEGDKVEEGDLLADIETDKATMAMEAANEGYIAKILVAGGTKDIPLGTLLCIQVESEADIAAFANYTAQETPTQMAPVPQPSLDASPAGVPPPVHKPPTTKYDAAPRRPEGRIFVSPLARKIAIDKSIDLSQVQGSGPDGRIRQQDVLRYLEQASKSPQPQTASTTPSSPAPAVKPVPGGDYVDIELTNIRKTVAKRLTESKQNIPHYYLSVDCDMGNLSKLRKEFNTSGDVKLSVNDFLIKAASLACLKVPEVNSHWQDTYIRQYNNVDVSVAVSTENGLITPIVFNAHTKGLGAISNDVSSLARKAKDGKLQPNEFMGGTFTISNLGMFGIKNFTAIINPPQSCILSVGRSREECVPDKSQEQGFSVVTVMTVTLSCDHRVVDGAVGAQWLQHFKRYVENPTTMLL